MLDPAETSAPPVPSSDTLPEALRRHGLELPPEHVAQLGEYCRLVWEINEHLNLTRHTDYEKFVTRDVVDCVELAKLLDSGATVLDVGTGGGVPGVVLRILRPDLQVTLSESVGKKARAVEQIVQQLKLPIAVHPGRAEELLAQRHFDAVVARAVGSLAKMLRWFKPHWDAIGCLLAIKGPKWVDERGEARHHGLLRDLELRKAAEYPMPGTQSASVILKLWPKPAA